MSEQRTIIFSIDEREVSCQFEGSVRPSSDDVLLLQDDNLLQDSKYNARGYGILNVTDSFDIETLKSSIQKDIAERLRSLKIILDDEFSLETYHNYVSNQEHLSFVTTIKDCIPVKHFPISSSLITSLVSEVLSQDLTLNCPSLDYKAVFCLRIVRPGKMQDANPPHKDVYIDRLRNAVNIYMPLAGSSASSSLSLLEGSHIWSEDDIVVSENNCLLNGTRYSVPTILDTRGPYKMTRPNPKFGELLFFSPYMIHGAGYNFEKDTTRVSLEMRLWKRSK